MTVQNNLRDEFHNTFPLAVSENIVVQHTEDEVLVYDLNSDRAICLNQTAALVWQNCNGKNDLAAITEILEKKLFALIDPDLVLFAINQLDDEGLLFNADSVPAGFEGLTRREVIRKIGFGSLVALPIVSAIVAPRAAFAQSCVNPGGGAPGTTGTNPLNCAGPVAACAALCMDPANFTNGCCSGTGVLVQPGADCNLGSGCFCQCT